MLIIDLPIIEWFDGLLARCHDIGIARRWLLRATVGLIIALEVFETVSWSLPAAGIMGGCCVLMTIADEARLRRGVEQYNSSQAMLRRVVPVFFLRLGFVAMDAWYGIHGILAGSLAGYVSGIDNAVWILWWYISATYQPTTPPKKHSWQDFFAAGRLARGAA